MSLFTDDAVVSWTIAGQSLTFTEHVSATGADQLTLTSVDGHTLSSSLSVSGAGADALYHFLVGHGATVTLPPPPPPPGGGNSGGVEQPGGPANF